ncbi:9316_t:CDS:1, partial [Funneliformis caledonium]
SDETNLSAFIVVDCTIHPANDLLAKWHLSSIFNNRFELPEFVNILTNLG